MMMMPLLLVTTEKLVSALQVWSEPFNVGKAGDNPPVVRT
jgi:hypothetical protein